MTKRDYGGNEPTIANKKGNLSTNKLLKDANNQHTKSSSRVDGIIVVTENISKDLLGDKQ